LPNLSTLQTSLNGALHRFESPIGDYRAFQRANFTQIYTIQEQAFTVSVQSWLDVQLGADFLLGDMVLTLTSSPTNGTGTSVVRAQRPHRNQNILRVCLCPELRYT